MRLINTELLVTILVVIIPLMVLFVLWSYAFHIWKLNANIRHEKKLKAIEQRQVEKLNQKLAIVRKGNPILEHLASKYNIIFHGGLGSGKTLVANLLVKYIVDKQEYNDYKNRRMLKYTNPGYMADLERLNDQGKLNVYSDITFEDDYGYTAHELWAYLTQRKRVVENGVLFADEIGTKLGKDQYYKQLSEQDPDYIAAANTARYARQDTNSVFIGTEQDKDNVWRPIREKGFLAVQMHGVNTWLRKKGKVLKWIRNAWLNVMPGLVTVNVREVLAIEFGRVNKIKAFLKLLLPAYFLTPKPYYIKRIEIAKDIKYKYTMFKAWLEYDGQLHYLIFTNKDIYKYNTRGHKAEYTAQFDENGNRKYSKETLCQK